MAQALPAVGLDPNVRGGVRPEVGDEGMLAKRLTPILNVSNIQESFAWFEKLGWKKAWDWGDPPDFGSVCNGDQEIFLSLNCLGCRRGPISSDVGDDYTGGVWMCWLLKSPADVDAFYNRALEQGVI